jgi:hypothetical protein
MFTRNQKHDSSDVLVRVLPQRICLMICDTEKLCHDTPASPVIHTAIKRTASHLSRRKMQQKLQTLLLISYMCLGFPE